MKMEHPVIEENRAGLATGQTGMADALETIAEEAERHMLFMGHDATDADIDAEGGDAAFVTLVAQRARQALEGARAHDAAAVAGEGSPCSVEALAAFIRRVDGNHSLGAGALAEKILDWMADGHRPR